MKIGVGSLNGVKLAAVESMVLTYPIWHGAHVIGVNVQSGVRPQPLDLSEILLGARNRAREAYEGLNLRIGDFGVGIEGGVTPVPYIGYAHFEGVAIYDGTTYSHGFSPGFELPLDVARLIGTGMTLNDAYHHLGLTENPSIGNAEGVIGSLTKGRCDRKLYAMHALTMALIRYENKELWVPK